MPRSSMPLGPNTGSTQQCYQRQPRSWIRRKPTGNNPSPPSYPKPRPLAGVTKKPPPPPTLHQTAGSPTAAQIQAPNHLPPPNPNTKPNRCPTPTPNPATAQPTCNAPPTKPTSARSTKNRSSRCYHQHERPEGQI
ncbi:uncharacterized protein LOC131328495 [Rhododendron vialii]|uniref:uncharacterized protein LOC131328495 n=1 Tax=Rhododendron vialii TaxID=182163 RepID=UPI00265DD42A|nr:uncharacterized protein LOC131328495 [Rhododendron vialii]